MRTKLLFVASLCLLTACASGDPEPDPKPRVSKRDQKIRKGKRAKATEKRVAPPVVVEADMVQFEVNKADLRYEVLPLIRKQAGVHIRYSGPPRTVTLRLLKPIHWRDAMRLVCQFTRTHLVRNYQGQFALEDGWSGELKSDLAESRSESRDSGRGGVSASGKQAPKPARRGGAASTRGSGSGSGYVPTVENTYGGGAQNASGRTAQNLLKNTTRSRSGSPRD